MQPLGRVQSPRPCGPNSDNSDKTHADLHLLNRRRRSKQAHGGDWCLLWCKGMNVPLPRRGSSLLLTSVGYSTVWTDGLSQHRLGFCCPSVLFLGGGEQNVNE